MNREEMEAKRIARWGKVQPYEEAFIDNRLPGSQKRLYKIINRGVLENRGVKPAIEGEHRFSVSLIEVPPGGGAKLHAHQTEEVFFPLNGKMIVYWGPNGEHETELGPWDCISIPIGMMRGFRNPTNETLVIYSVVGGTDAEVGRIQWHSEVIESAKKTGLEFDDAGYLKSTKN